LPLPIGQSEKVNLIAPGSNASRYPDWIPAAILAALCGVTYLAVRPPLFDNDGYRDHIYGLQPDGFYAFNPHHLLWIPGQALIARIAAALGDPTTVPFQLVGILVSTVTLFLFYVLLRRACDNPLFASSAIAFIAFSPEFWHLGLQNRVYAFVFLGLVIYLMLWQTPDGTPPTGSRLVAAGLLIVLLALLQQAMVLLVGAGAIVLIALSKDPWRAGIFRALAWSAGIGLTVFLAYVSAWSVVATDQPFVRWTLKFAYVLHSPSLYDLGLPMCLIKAAMGLSGVLLQSVSIKDYLSSNYSSRAIYTLYASIGILGLVGILWWALRDHVRQIVARLVQINALFAVSILSMLLWIAFVVIWQPAEPHFWCAALFPALLCFGMLQRERGWPGVWILAAVFVLLSGWNLYFDLQHDQSERHNFPEPLLASIQQRVGPRGIFVILDVGVGVDVDYDLLFECLHYSPHDSGIAIDDYLADGDQGGHSWQQRLHDKIETVLDSGGPVFVAEHVLEPGSYSDLSGRDNPFAIAIYKGAPTISGPKLRAQVQQVLADYVLSPSDFAIDDDRYLILTRKTR
jgi:hypothetical protein